MGIADGSLEGWAIISVVDWLGVYVGRGISDCYAPVLVDSNKHDRAHNKESTKER